VQTTRLTGGFDFAKIQENNGKYFGFLGN